MALARCPTAAVLLVLAVLALAQAQDTPATYPPTYGAPPPPRPPPRPCRTNDPRRICRPPSPPRPPYSPPPPLDTGKTGYLDIRVELPLSSNRTLIETELCPALNAWIRKYAKTSTSSGPQVITGDDSTSCTLIARFKKRIAYKIVAGVSASEASALARAYRRPRFVKQAGLLCGSDFFVQDATGNYIYIRYGSTTVNNNAQSPRRPENIWPPLTTAQARCRRL